MLTQHLGILHAPIRSIWSHDFKWYYTLSDITLENKRQAAHAQKVVTWLKKLEELQKRLPCWRGQTTCKQNTAPFLTTLSLSLSLWALCVCWAYDVFKTLCHHFYIIKSHEIKICARKVEPASSCWFEGVAFETRDTGWSNLSARRTLLRTYICNERHLARSNPRCRSLQMIRLYNGSL